MIQNKFGSKVEIIACYGKVAIEDAVVTLVFCRITFAPGTEQESSRVRYMFAENLHGDGLEKAIADAPQVTLKNEMLTMAMMEALC